MPSPQSAVDSNKTKSLAPSRAVFLGAGASKAFGYPLTAEILDRIKQKLDSGTLFGGKRSADMQKTLVSHLQSLVPGWRSKDIKLPLITEVLSLVDYSLQTSTAPLRGKGTAELADCRRLLERAIYEIIDDEYEGEPLDTRETFIDWLLADSRRTGMITSNYDMELEEGIFRRVNIPDIESGFDFGFAWRDPEDNKIRSRPQVPLFRIYKLHGSVNWLRCDLCEQTYIQLRGPIGDLAFETDPQSYNSCWCGHHMLSLVLVAPSFVRDVRNPDLLHTWKNALELLRRSRDWYIIGYSFPPEDLAIRSLFLRAYNGRWDDKEVPPRVTVVQMEHREEQKAAIQSRYRSLFPDCKFFWDGLEDFVKSL